MSNYQYFRVREVAVGTSSNYSYDSPLCADQRLFNRNILDVSNDGLSSESCRPIAGGVIGRKVPVTDPHHMKVGDNLRPKAA